MGSVMLHGECVSAPQYLLQLAEKLPFWPRTYRVLAANQNFRKRTSVKFQRKNTSLKSPSCQLSSGMLRWFWALRPLPTNRASSAGLGAPRHHEGSVWSGRLGVVQFQVYGGYFLDLGVLFVLLMLISVHRLGWRGWSSQPVWLPLEQAAEDVRPTDDWGGGVRVRSPHSSRGHRPTAPIDSLATYLGECDVPKICEWM